MKHPILAVELPRSWIRILGRLTIALEVSLERRATLPSVEEFDEECIEALATILFCAGLLLDTSRTTEMPLAVVDPLAVAHAGLARSTRTILAGKPTAEAAVRQKVQALMARHRLELGKNKQGSEIQ